MEERRNEARESGGERSETIKLLARIGFPPVDEDAGTIIEATLVIETMDELVAPSIKIPTSAK